MVKRQMPSTCAMLSWLITWAAEIMNKFKVQQDGRTAYEATAKHECSHLIVGFGEHIRWQLTPQKPVPDMLDGDWRDGIFLGVIWKQMNTLWEHGKAFSSVVLSKPDQKKQHMTQIALIMLPQHMKTLCYRAQNPREREELLQSHPQPKLQLRPSWRREGENGYLDACTSCRPTLLTKGTLQDVQDARGCETDLAPEEDIRMHVENV